MNRHLPSLRVVFVTAMTLLLAGVAAVQAQTGATQSQRPMMVDETQAASMMAERQEMMASMRAMDQKLNDLVAKMNTARGNEKVEAIATVVKELVAQRTQMREQMATMQTRMMDHMMEHMMSMQGGMMGMMSNRGQAGAMQPMSNCPMMKELSKEAEDADHSTHHPEK